MVDEEDVDFNEEYMNESDPSILHFLLASGDDVWLLLLYHLTCNVYEIIEALIFVVKLCIGVKQATPGWSDDNAHCRSWDYCCSIDMDLSSSF